MMDLVESLDSESRMLLAIWNAQAPPIRPSAKDVEWYAQGWNAREGLRVLILGVTPELVDLALRKNASRIIAMDWHEPYFHAMRCLGCEDWTRVEGLLNDWRIFVPELEGNLDTVLGDGSLTMLTFPQEWEQVLTDIRRYLVPGGRLVFRLPFQTEESFDLDIYLKETLSNFDARCGGVEPEQRLGMLREMISEIRIAFGLASSRNSGDVDFNHRADLVRLFHTELTARYGHLKEWDIVRVGMPPEEDIRKGKRTGKAVPQWKAAADLIEACGFCMKSVKCSGTRPVPAVMRLFVAERI
jgi:hypothetical protein